MNAFVQFVVVAAIVACASGYAGLKLMPKAWRKGVAAGAARWAARSGLSDATARRVEAKLASGGACGSCDSCKACATTPTRDTNDEPAEMSPGRWKIVTLRRGD